MKKLMLTAMMFIFFCGSSAILMAQEPVKTQPTTEQTEQTEQPALKKDDAPEVKKDAAKAKGEDLKAQEPATAKPAAEEPKPDKAVADEPAQAN